MEELNRPVNEITVEEPVRPPKEKDIAKNQKQQKKSEEEDSFIDKIKQGSRTLVEKSTQAKNKLAERIAKNDVENYSLQEAMAKIEKDVFAGTKILEDLDTKFMGSARKLRDQIARKAAKTIYERWHNDREKEEMKEAIELDYNDV